MGFGSGQFLLFKKKTSALRQWVSSLSFLKLMETQGALVDVVTCNAVLTAIGTQAGQAGLLGWSAGWMGETDSTWFLKCPFHQKRESQKWRKHGRRQQIVCLDSKNMGVFKNRDTPKWTGL